MAIPKNISKEHLLKAIEKIDKEGIPADADSQYYDVVYNEKKYPPKIIVSYSNLFATPFSYVGTNLHPSISKFTGLRMPLFSTFIDNFNLFFRKRKIVLPVHQDRFVV